MNEGRRHSVDIPLSRTLVALKRVRSLRDPGTNSMSKFALYIDNMNCKVNSSIGSCLELSNPDNHSLSRSQNLDVDVEGEDVGSNSESNFGSRTCKPRGSYMSTRQVHETCRNCMNESLDTMVPYSMNHVDGEVNSYSKTNFKLAGCAHARWMTKKSACDRLRKPSDVADVAMSRVGSPSISAREVRTNALSHSSLGLTNEEADIADSIDTGCGISYCWSRTPKSSTLKLSSDIEEQECPLLSAEGGEIACGAVAVRSESSRSLSHKYRPRSFNELVGQHVVVQSLSNGISKGRIAPVYLFHGPRGTGKTSTARIFAAALNCLSVKENKPCGFCQECMLLFSGRSRDVKELDAAKINHKDRVKSLLKSASRAPFSSRFKVFIIDECQFLHGQTWSAIFNNLDECSQHAIFVMITCDLEKLPEISISRCQRYHFPKVKDSDIVFRLQKICIEEGLDFDKDALDFIAVKSNGSLRDAETLLDQLGLLGKRITIPLAYELIGFVSDDELLDLLDLAMSSDTTNTVRRARELLGSRVDPMQLISQLANLIMDILAGRHGPIVSGNCGNHDGRQFLVDVGMQQLRHALKILSETEKQLRTSKNQATWLTVALLQFSSEESSFPRTHSLRDDGVLSTVSPRESLKRFCCECSYTKSNCSDMCYDKKNLKSIWRKAIANCQSNSLRNFLQKEGKLSSIYFGEGLAIAELEFHCPDHVSRVEKSWKMIASSLQCVIGCNVEIRAQLVPRCKQKNSKVKRQIFNLLNCYGRTEEIPNLMENENETEASLRRNTSGDACSSQQRHQFSPLSYNSDSKLIHNSNSFRDKTVTTRCMERNVRSPGTTTSQRSLQENLQSGNNFEFDYSKIGGEVQHMNFEESEIQPSCFAKTLKLQRFLSSEVAQTICFRLQSHDALELSFRKDAPFDGDCCTNIPYVFCSRSNTQFTDKSRVRNGPRSNAKLSSKQFCWRAPKASP